MEQRTETESRGEPTAPAAAELVTGTMIQYVNRETNNTPTDKRGPSGPRDRPMLYRFALLIHSIATRIAPDYCRRLANQLAAEETARTAGLEDVRLG